MHSLNSEWFLNCALLNSPPCSNAMPMEESNAVLFLIEVKPSSCWLKHYFSVSNVTKDRMCDCDPLVPFGQLQLPLNEAELLSLSEKRQMVILKWSVLMCAPISLCLFFFLKAIIFIILLLFITHSLFWLHLLPFGSHFIHNCSLLVTG